jgi:hypothetical protein
MTTPEGQLVSAISRAPRDYLTRVMEMLAEAGEDGWVLRIEQRNVWTMSAEMTGGTVITSQHAGDIADVTLSGAGDVYKVKPRGNQVYAVAQILVHAVEHDSLKDME